MGSPSRLPVPIPEPAPLPQRAPVQPKRPSRWKYAVLAALIGGGVWLAYQLLNRAQTGQGEMAPSVQTAKVETGPLERVIRLTGETSARNFASITVPIMRGPDGAREMVLIKLAGAGSQVKKGDLIAQIDSKSAEDHIEDSKAGILQADSDIKKRRAEHSVDWENLQQTLRVAKADLDKASLDQRAAEVRTTLDQELLKLSVEENTARHKQLQGDLASRKTIQNAELRILDITRQRNVMHVDRHLIDLKRMTFTAPMNGLVVMSTFFRAGENVQIQLGDQVYSGQTIMKIVDTSQMQVQSNANQSESNLIRIGQPARISLDAFPGLRFPGKVYSIAAMGTGGMRQSYYVRNVPVRIAIDGADPRLIPDLSAAVDVVVERKEDATLVPLSALQSRAGKPVVFVKRGQRFEPAELTLGRQNATHVDVVSGVSPGDEIALEPIVEPAKTIK